VPRSHRCQLRRGGWMRSMEGSEVGSGLGRGPLLSCGRDVARGSNPLWWSPINVGVSSAYFRGVGILQTWEEVAVVWPDSASRLGCQHSIGIGTISPRP
jgi:hypothetical protein